MARILAAPGDAPTSRRERPARAESVVVPPRARAAATAASALRALHALGPARRAALGLAVAALLLAVVLVVRHETGRPAVATAAALPPGQTFTLAWGGDFTPGSAYGRPPDRARGMLGAVAGRLRRADVAALNLEGTFGRGGPEKCAPGQSPTCFAFQAPARNAVALGDAGVDVVNLANNHAWDYGAAGMGQTVTAVRRHGAKVTGRPGEITLVDLPRARVAFLGFAAYRWASPIRDLLAVRGLVQRAAQQANVVVVLMHAGAEGAGQSRTPDLDEEAFGEQRGNPRAFAHTAVDAGADLVLGSGPHVLRGMELYRGPPHRLLARQPRRLPELLPARRLRAQRAAARPRRAARHLRRGGLRPARPAQPGDPGPRRLAAPPRAWSPASAGWTSDPAPWASRRRDGCARPGRPRLRGPRGRGANGNTRPLQG